MAKSDTAPMARISTTAGQSHSSSYSRGRTQGRLVSITVRKDNNPKAKAGIQLEQDKSGQVTVINIAKNGLFGDSELEIGDVILSVNRQRLSDDKGPEALLKAVHEHNTISISVRKPAPTGAPLRRKKKKPISHKNDNNRVKTDTYYAGSAKHNADGSLRVERESETPKASVKKSKTVTITAKKSSSHHLSSSSSSSSNRVGLRLAIQDQKLVVMGISHKSIFRPTKLSVGDCILSINDMSFRRYADVDYALNVMNQAKLMVTLVVEKSQGSMSRSAHGSDKTGLRNSSGRRAGRRNGEASSSRSPRTSYEFEESSSSSSSSDDNEDGDEFADDFASEYNHTIETEFRIEKYKPVTISVPKSRKSQSVGLEFKVVRTTRGTCSGHKTSWVYIDEIHEDSIFRKTSLKEGDKVICINNSDLRETPDTNLAYKTCCVATETVALVVLKDEKIFKQRDFWCDNSITNLEWKV